MGGANARRMVEPATDRAWHAQPASKRVESRTRMSAMQIAADQ